MPAKFRAAFSDGVVLAKWLDPCVALFTPAAFDGFTDSVLPALNPVSSERRKLGRWFAGNSWETGLDSAGRVTFAPQLLAHAGIEKDVVVVGNIDHLEVWDRGRWQAQQSQLDSEVVEIAESLGHPS